MVKNIFTDCTQYTREDIIDTLNMVTDIITYTPDSRPLNMKNQPGAILHLPKNRSTYIVGDLHANMTNFTKIYAYFEENNILETDNVLFLGDLLHSTNEPKNGFLSLNLLMVMLKLISSRPENVFLLRGNHETVLDNLMKNGLCVSFLFNDYIRKNYGQATLNEMGTFFSRLPLVALGDNFIASHAGPTKGVFKYSDILNCPSQGPLFEQLVFNKSYSAADVEQFKKQLDYPEESLFVVGHHRLDGDSSLVVNFKNIHNHYVLQSDKEASLQILKITDGIVHIINVMEKLI